VTHAEIKQAIRRRFNAEIGVTRDVKVQYGDHPFERPEALWVRCTLQFGESRQVETGGTKRQRVTGLIVAQVFDPVNEGDADATEMADWIAAAFRAVSANQVTYQMPRIEERGRDQNEWQIDVICPFYSDEVS